MQLTEIEKIKTKISTKILKGDYVTLGKILGVKKETAIARYRRNNESTVIVMQKIVESKEKMIEKLKLEYNQRSIK